MERKRHGGEADKEKRAPALDCHAFELLSSNFNHAFVLLAG